MGTPEILLMMAICTICLGMMLRPISMELRRIRIALEQHDDPQAAFQRAWRRGEP